MLSMEVLELLVEGGRVRPSNVQGFHGVIPQKVTDCIDKCVPDHTVDRRHSWILPPNAASVEVLGDDH